MNGGDGPLTQKARELAARNRAYQQELNAALEQSAGDPGGALERLRRVLPKADALEAREIECLHQQIAQCRTAWAGNRLQTLMAQAQALILLNRPAEAMQTIAEARQHLAGDPLGLAAPFLVELEAMASAGRV
jgi:hypothetical protein